MLRQNYESPLPSLRGRKVNFSCGSEISNLSKGVHNPTEFEKYRYHVEQMFDEQSDAVIENTCTNHARVLIETLVSRSKEQLLLFCENLKKEFYEDPKIMGEMVTAMRRGVEIRILTQHHPEAVSLVERLQAASGKVENGTFSIMVCDADSSGAKADMNFVVMDRKAFRFEEDRVNHSAVASANRKELALKLSKVFDSFALKSSSIPAVSAH